MRRNIFVISLIFVAMLSFTSSAQDATSAWNQYCELFHFKGYPVGASHSFADSYLGNNLSADFNGIKAAVAGVMSTTSPIDPDDVMNASLENWPSSGVRQLGH
jgi:hypothetical protein